MKGLRVTKIEEIKFEGVWVELEAKHCFQRQSFTEYLKLTLVFIRNSVLREKFHFCFSRVFVSISVQIFILAGRLGTGLLFYGVLRLS